MKTLKTANNDRNDIWEWIRYRLSLNGYTFGKLARKHKVATTNFTKVKRAPYPKYERILADLVGKDPWDLWPDRYDAEHNPNRVSSRYQGHKRYLNNTRNDPEIKSKIERGAS